MREYREAAAVADRLAKADPGNAGSQRDLSVSYDRIGDVLVAQGTLAEALTSFRDSLAIRDRLAKADPGNAGSQRDLSVSLRARSATRWLRKAISPRRRLAFRDSLAIADRLAKADPGNAGWQRDLVGVARQGRRRAGCARQSRRGADDRFATASRLPTASPRPIPATRAGSAISRCRTSRHRRRAGCARQSGRGADARFATASRSATVSPRPIPSNAGWQRDLSVSYIKVGDVLVEQGNLAEALTAFRDSLAIRSASPRPIPATRAGSVISRCRTRRSATCWLRKAIWPRR